MGSVFQPSSMSGTQAVRNPTLINGRYYRDDVNGIYVYYSAPVESIYIESYPRRPSLNGTYVYAGDPRFSNMKSKLEIIGTDVTMSYSPDDASSVSAPPASPGAYQLSSPSRDVSGYVTTAPQDRLPEKPGRGAKPKKQPQQDEINYLPWVIGGGILTLGLGLAIIFIPIKKRKE